MLKLPLFPLLVLILPSFSSKSVPLYITYLAKLFNNKHSTTDKSFLFRPECLDGIKAGGVPGRVKAEE
jgi:hypothetical protein